MKKNLVVVGYGGMGGWHGEYALKSDVVNLLGVWDIKKERLELAESRGIYAYSSLDEVLNDDRVDICVIATPNDVHVTVVNEVLRGGKHVICEKPVSMNMEELDDMIKTANETGKLFTVHQNRRWDVDFLAMKQIVNSGEIGDMMNIESRIHGSRGIPSDWRGQKPYGGGMLFDWGVHLIDQILQLLPNNKVVSLNCRFDNLTNTEVDDGFKLNLYFDNGVSAYIEVGTYNFIAMPRFYLRCRKGTAMIRDWREETQVVKCKAWHESDVVPVKTAAGLTKTMAPRDSVTTDSYSVARPQSDVHDFYRNFCKAIDGLEPMLVTHEEIRRSMAVMMAGFESNDKNQIISVNI
ncbi:MAG: Gfo/Idh/MocA family protein [Eubacteriales bacterium]